MSQNLNDEEQDFLANILSQRNDLSIEENEDSPILAKKVDKKELKKKNKANKKKNKIPGYKNPAHWIGAFLLLPVILSSIVFIGILRVESFFGKDTLEWLSGQKVDSSMREIAEQAGMGWLPDFLVFYDYRWVIIMSLFTICFTIAIVIMILDARRLKKENSKNDDVNNDTEDSSDSVGDNKDNSKNEQNTNDDTLDDETVGDDSE